MRRFAWQFLAIASAVFVTLSANGETRPQYGGTLHVSMRAAPTSLDPADRQLTDASGQRSLSALLFDTLVILNASGQEQPSLATSWQPIRGNQRWQFRIRHGVTFHDGSPLTAEAAAASLRYANPSWNVLVEGDSVIIERVAANLNLLAELALPRNAIAKRDSDPLKGTGPYRIVEWQAGKKLVLEADENYWRGRPYLDGIEIEFNKNSREQMTALEVGKADLVELAPEVAHRISPDKFQVLSSPPTELMALLFVREAATPDERALREALRLSVERGSIRNVLLQGAGQPTGGILPTWMTGYGFVFSAEADLAKARQAKEQARTNRAWSIGYDAADPLGRVVADRIALNARDAGLSLQPTLSAATADVRLVRIALVSDDPWIALEGIVNECNLAVVKSTGNSIEDLYAMERAELAEARMIPLFHLPISYASNMSLRKWSVRVDGSLDLSDAWLESKPKP